MSGQLSQEEYLQEVGNRATQNAINIYIAKSIIYILYIYIYIYIYIYMDSPMLRMYTILYRCYAEPLSQVTCTMSC